MIQLISKKKLSDNHTIYVLNNNTYILIMFSFNTGNRKGGKYRLILCPKLHRVSEVRGVNKMECSARNKLVHKSIYFHFYNLQHKKVNNNTDIRKQTNY